MRPTEPIGSLGETVLKACRFAVVFKLLQGRLTNVNNGEPIKVPALDLPWWKQCAHLRLQRNAHAPSPPCSAILSGSVAASPAGRSARPVSGGLPEAGQTIAGARSYRSAASRRLLIQRASARRASALTRISHTTKCIGAPN